MLENLKRKKERIFLSQVNRQTKNFDNIFRNSNPQQPPQSISAKECLEKTIERILSPKRSEEARENESPLNAQRRVIHLLGQEHKNQHQRIQSALRSRHLSNKPFNQSQMTQKIKDNQSLIRGTMISSQRVTQGIDPSLIGMDKKKVNEQ